MAWFAYVPLLLALRGVAPWSAGLLGAGTGIVGLPMAFWWIGPSIERYLEVSFLTASVTFVVFVLWHAGQISLFAVLLSHLRATTSPLLAAAAWVVCETLMPRLFPWQLGQALEPHLPFIQSAELGGPLLLSAVVMAVNGWIALAIDAATNRMQRIRAIGLIILTIGAMEAYGQARLAAEHEANRIAERHEIAVLQGNLPAVRNNSPEFVARALSAYSRLARSTVSNKPALIVWPEAALRTDLLQDRETLSAVSALANETGALQLIGAGSRLEEGRDGSGAFLVSASGDVIGAYHKTKLFPFSETVPFAFGFVRRWLPADDLAAGDLRTAMLIPGTRIAPSICYEAMFSGFHRDAVLGGATFAVNMTNDAWFGDTAGPRQHLQSAVLRAVESRRWLVRSANSGISAIIDSTGRITEQTRLFEPATLTAAIARRTEITPYMRFGEWVFYLALLLVGGRVASRVSLRARKPR